MRSVLAQQREDVARMVTHKEETLDEGMSSEDSPELVALHAILVFVWSVKGNSVDIEAPLLVLCIQLKLVEIDLTSSSGHELWQACLVPSFPTVAAAAVGSAETQTPDWRSLRTTLGHQALGFKLLLVVVKRPDCNVLVDTHA